jgi:hypothetical protein
LRLASRCLRQRASRGGIVLAAGKSVGWRCCTRHDAVRFAVRHDAGDTEQFADQSQATNSMPKMKSYPSFDAYLADQPARNRSLIGALREFVQRAAPDLVEAVKWGNGCWVNGKAPVAYVYSAPSYVQFGFTQGAQLRDPLGLLHGEGQYVRHIPVRTRQDIDEGAFAALLRQALKKPWPPKKAVPRTARRRATKAKTRTKAMD